MGKGKKPSRKNDMKRANSLQDRYLEHQEKLSMDYLKTLKDHNEAHLWMYASALIQMQEAIFALEMDEANPKALQVLARRALEVGHELKGVLSVLEETIED